MIRDWLVIAPRGDSTGPIGDPFMANQVYLSVFYTLESLALGQCTDAELAHWRFLGTYSIAEVAADEKRRREELDR